MITETLRTEAAKLTHEETIKFCAECLANVAQVGVMDHSLTVQYLIAAINLLKHALREFSI